MPGAPQVRSRRKRDDEDEDGVEDNERFVYLNGMGDA